jgi:hypothetical protein
MKILIGPTLVNLKPEIKDFMLDCGGAFAELEQADDREAVADELLENMSDKRIIQSLNRVYGGGFKQFISDYA